MNKNKNIVCIIIMMIIISIYSFRLTIRWMTQQVHVRRECRICSWLLHLRSSSLSFLLWLFWVHFWFHLTKQISLILCRFSHHQSSCLILRIYEFHSLLFWPSFWMLFYALCLINLWYSLLILLLVISFIIKPLPF